MSMNDNIASLDRNFKWITRLPILRAGSPKDQQWLSRSDSGLIRRTTGIYFVPFEGSHAAVRTVPVAL